MKKCPNCGSSKYHELNGKSHCNNCGFTNDKTYGMSAGTEIELQKISKKGNKIISIN
jgi:uncharacterized Zn finger protein (UPF0148 family)